MRSTFLTGLFLCIVIVSSLALPDPSPEPPPLPALTLPQESIAQYEWYPVVKVVDGDTIVVNIEGKHTTVRLIGLDTPETVDPRKTVQCFGVEASAELKKVLSGQYARLEIDPSQGERDKYGRFLAYVYAPANVRPEGILLNRYMIAEGYGHEYTYAIPYKYQADFQAAEADARLQKKGLWADGACASKTSSPTTAPLSAGGPYECSHNTYNCPDFTTQSEAQAAFDACGPSDVHKLDSDGDKAVCESLP